MCGNNEYVDGLFIGSDLFCDIREVKLEFDGAKALAEVYQIFQHCSRDINKSIPQSFIKFLEENMDKTWRCNLDLSKKLNEMELLSETRTFLYLIRRDFLCSEAERTELVQKDKSEAEASGEVYEDFSLRDYFPF